MCLRVLRGPPYTGLRAFPTGVFYFSIQRIVWCVVIPLCFCKVTMTVMNMILLVVYIVMSMSILYGWSVMRKSEFFGRLINIFLTYFSVCIFYEWIYRIVVIVIVVCCCCCCCCCVVVISFMRIIYYITIVVYCIIFRIKLLWLAIYYNGGCSRPNRLNSTGYKEIMDEQKRRRNLNGNLSWNRFSSLHYCQ